MVGDANEIWFERRKWPATPHYGHPAWILGEDDFGLWFEVRVDTPWRRGDEFLFHGPFDAVVLVSANDDFVAWFHPTHGELDIYVDVVTDVERASTVITAVDLDLDVVRFRDDRRVELLDEDEFAQHQVELGYSSAMIEHAERVAATVLEAVRRGAAPFDDRAPRRWLDAASWSPRTEPSD